LEIKLQILIGSPGITDVLTFLESDAFDYIMLPTVRS